MKLELSKLVVNATDTVVDFPGLEDFKVTVCYLTREELLKIRKKATSTKFDKRSHTPVEEVDSDLFQDMYIKAVVKGWSGLKMSYLSKLLPVDLTGIDDKEAELEYSHNNALELMKNSANFDGFISDLVSDLQNFTKTA